MEVTGGDGGYWRRLGVEANGPDWEWRQVKEATGGDALSRVPVPPSSFIGIPRSAFRA